MKNKNIDSLAESISNDTKVRLAIHTIANNLDDRTKTFLINCYTSNKLASIYSALRNEAYLNPHKNESKRHVAKFPNLIVYNFLNDYLSPKYGDDWISNTRKFSKIARNEDLVKPWIIQKV